MYAQVLKTHVPNMLMNFNSAGHCDGGVGYCMDLWGHQYV